MVNISPINNVNPNLYSPSLTEKSQGTGIYTGENYGGNKVGAYTSVQPTAIEQFKQDMQRFASERSASNPATVNQPNQYVQNQGLYDAVSAIGTRELSPVVDCTFDDMG